MGKGKLFFQKVSPSPIPLPFQKLGVVVMCGVGVEIGWIFRNGIFSSEIMTLFFVLTSLNFICYNTVEYYLRK